VSIETYGVTWEPVPDKHRTWFGEFGDGRTLLYREGSKSTALWILLVTDAPVDSLTHQVWLGAERQYITGTATAEEACQLAWRRVTGQDFPREPTTAELVRQDVQEALDTLENAMTFMDYLTDDYERLSEVRDILGRALGRDE
jgi:hypothetical protein